MSPNAGDKERGCGVSANKYSYAHGAQINFGYLKTINVPVFFMARYIMVLRGATSLLGALEGVGPENQDFFGP
jgi:hypothetical protein